MHRSSTSYQLNGTPLAANSGFRRAVEDAVLELRVAGVTPAAIHALQAAGTASSIATVLEHYSSLLASHGLADAAAVFAAALDRSSARRLSSSMPRSCSHPA